MTNRKNQILERLSVAKLKKISVSELAEQLKVSQVTIRKDLDSLAETGIIIREHGYVILSDTNDVYARLAYHYEEKKQIAIKAAELVNDGETLMIETGSCCALLAQTLTETKKDLTIITNCAFIADFIRHKTFFQIILLGGIYQHESQTMVGPMVRECAQNFYVKRFFIGAEGFSEEFGIMGSDQMRGQAIKDMAHQAESLIVLAESTKFDKYGTVPSNITHKVTHIITDKMLSEEKRAQIKAMNIKIVTA